MKRALTIGGSLVVVVLGPGDPKWAEEAAAVMPWARIGVIQPQLSAPKQ